MTQNLPTPRVTAAIPARAVGMAAPANKQDAQAGRAFSLRCRDFSWHNRKGRILAEMDLLIFAFFAFETVSYLVLLFSMRKQKEKSHDITTEHSKQ
jgi:hypothetical protein